MESHPKKQRTNEECSFGQHLEQQCHQKTSKEIRPFKDLSDDDQIVYRWRAGIASNISITMICKFHENLFGDAKFKKYSKCCDPYNSHKKRKKPDGTHNIVLEWAEQLKLKGIYVVPGWKVCRNCQQRIKELIRNKSYDDLLDVDCGEFMPDVYECDQSVLESTMNMAEQRNELNECWQLMGISPLKTHAVPKSTKVKEACEKIKRSQEKQKELAKELFQLPDRSLLEKKENVLVDKETASKANNFDRLMFLMKEKLKEKSLSTSLKIQVLTMAPLDWQRQRVANFFQVSDYLVREARKLCEEKGILALPRPKRARSLLKEIEDSIKMFYEDDEYSRLMPGTKDYVSIARNVHKQKRLLLCNLKELYLAYKEKFPQHKIKLSKFCQLRPKWCVPVSSAGTHSVCVCKIHQNAKLMVDAFCNTINTVIKRRKQAYFKENAEREYNGNDELEKEDFSSYNVTYKDLLQVAVCDTENMECMIHRCESCPTYSALQSYLETKLEDYEINEDISFTQWDSTDRTTLQTHVAPVDEFVEKLVYSIDNLSTHSFVAQSQSQFLKSRKEAMDNKTCILLLDFAETIIILYKMKSNPSIGTRISALSTLWLYFTKMKATKLCTFVCV